MYTVATRSHALIEPPREKGVLRSLYDAVRRSALRLRPFPFPTCRVAIGTDLDDFFRGAVLLVKALSKEQVDGWVIYVVSKFSPTFPADGFHLEQLKITKRNLGEISSKNLRMVFVRTSDPSRYADPASRFNYFCVQLFSRTQEGGSLISPVPLVHNFGVSVVTVGFRRPTFLKFGNPLTISFPHFAAPSPLPVATSRERKPLRSRSTTAAVATSTPPSTSLTADGEDHGHPLRRLREDDCAAAPPKRRRTDAVVATVPEIKTPKRLVLLLDLDHTLLHTIPAARLSPGEAYLLRRPKQPGLLETQRMLFDLRKTEGIITKIRPFVRTFLQEAGAMYDLRICTKGNRRYAQCLARLLDPHGTHFRTCDIIAREDFREKSRKCLNVVPGADERADVIVDDTAEVWEHHLDNLVAVRPYGYFAFRGRPGAKSHAEMGTDEDEQASGALAKTLILLRRVHATFLLLGADGDVRDVLRRLRKKPQLHGTFPSDQIGATCSRPDTCAHRAQLQQSSSSISRQPRAA